MGERTRLARRPPSINVLEREHGRPLISAIVVHKSDDWMPGVGFWNIAREIGIDPGSSEASRLEFWVREFSRCHSYWKSRKSGGESKLLDARREDLADPK